MPSATGLLSFYQPRYHVGQIPDLFLDNADHVYICSTPETFDIVSQTVDIPVRKNLSQISRVLTQVTRGEEFGDDSPCYVPINDFVRNAMRQFSGWLVQGMCHRRKFTRICRLTIISG